MDNYTSFSNSSGNSTSHGSFTGGFLHGSVYLVYFTYIYFIPRMIAFRCSSINEDKAKAHFFTMTVLMVTVVVLAVVRLGEAFSRWGTTDSKTTLVWMCMSDGLQKSISPLVLYISIQQFAFFAQFDYHEYFLEGPIQYLYCGAVLLINLLTNSIELTVLFSNESTVDSELLEDPLDPNIVTDVAIPLFTLIVFQSIQTKYKNQGTIVDGIIDDSPTPLDQVAKIAWFQGVMALLSILAVSVRGTNTIFEDDVWDFLAAARTPALSWIAFRSILRKERPIRPCFLLCCTGEQRPMRHIKGVSQSA